MKQLFFLTALIGLLMGFFSCEKDEREIEVSPKVYMPQATYGHSYIVPNNGTDAQLNKNYEIDKANRRVKIYLGVYRSGLGELKGFSVDVSAGNAALDGTALLPTEAYTLSSKATVENGKRDAIIDFFVDLDYLLNNSDTDFSLPVTISNLTFYEFNENYTTTKVLIKTRTLLQKENLIP